ADGSLEGSNTDVYGFCENLRDTVPEWRPDAGPAVVLGAGGSARAVVAALADLGVGEIRVVNRTIARAERLARDLAVPGTRLAAYPWGERARVLEDAGIVVNTTSLG